MKKIIIVISSVLLLFVLSGAACIRQTQVNKITADYGAALDGYLGMTKKEVLFSKLGKPTEQESIEGVDIWTYNFSYGTMSNANAYGNQYYAGANASSWEMKDIIVLYFENGICSNYKVNVQR
jgi:outer membrane protein assembly factor BamE (lipoprotein component of BamABCDE complex)